MKAMPTVQKFMSTQPHTIGRDLPVLKAHQMMRELEIRHLPVQDGGKLVGIITDRDIKLAASFADAKNLKVEDVMSQDPYIVHPDANLNEVVMTMAEKKFGAAIVESNHKTVGIFTAVDALRVLSETLDQNYRSIKV